MSRLLLGLPAGDRTGEFCLEIGLIVHDAVQQDLQLISFVFWKSERIKTPDILTVCQPGRSTVDDIPSLKDVHFLQASVIVSKLRIIFKLEQGILFYMEVVDQL